MEVELFVDETSADENCGLDGNTEEHLKLDGERCGICMDMVFDRGVLDCCQHWFCFTCIDNWATITSLCPLCQNEFQLITCVPVYDTDGGNQTDDESNLSDDDWFIEGKNSTLSFPSYFIDESAVVCLGEHGCKVQSGSVALDEESDIDTSIACDSCDKWYHAFCVGFDPEGSCDISWLCPRCTILKDPQKTCWKDDQDAAEFVVSNHVAKASTSGRLSDSFGDENDTSIDTSIIDSHLETQYSSKLILDSNKDCEDTWEDCPKSNALDSEATQQEGRNCESDLCQISADDTVQEGVSVPDKNVMASELDPRSGVAVYSDVESMPTFPEPADSSKYLLSGITIFHEKEIVTETTAPKRKHIISSSRHMDNGEDNFLTKKLKLEGDDQPMSPMERPAELTIEDGAIPISSQEEFMCGKDDDAFDIMEIVKGTDDRSLKQLRCKSLSDKNERESASGFRLKKILRGDGKDSSVHELRNKIREAVSNKSSGDLGKNLFDPKLLDAFRAALAGSGSEHMKATLVKGHNSFLQKGTSRENLTKKIYGAGGKRKRAWARDCEVEFWKHRSIQQLKADKVETLKSVLDLLKDNCIDVTKLTPARQEVEKNSPVLERLYLADTSIFPRKNDIRPVSAPKIVETSVQRDHGSIGKSSTSEAMVRLSDNGAELSSVKVMKSGNSAHQKQESFSHATVGLKKPKNKDKPVKPDVKVDKKKWALEVLARKTVTSSHRSEENEGDSSILKGKFSLVGQLPKDMRPVLAPCRNTKISVPVRQAQLNRFTEHFLKRPKTIGRTAETELAIADAVNIEKQVAEKSNSKLVYLNLCSQELLRISDDANYVVRVEGSNLCSSSKHPSVEEPKETDERPLGIDVHEALIKAGLITHSPASSSSNHSGTQIATELDSKVDEKEGPEKILQIDPHKEADFEYTSEDADFVGASSLIAPKQISEPAAKPEKQAVESVQPPDSMMIANVVDESCSAENEVQVCTEQEESNRRRSVTKKVEAYIKEHLRPLCKSSVITVEEYRWAVGKTTEKVMKYHSKEKNASFLIREGDKVKKLASQYLETAALANHDSK